MKKNYMKLIKKYEPIKKITKRIKVFNYGLAILKVISAFLVVVHHNYNRNSTKNKIIVFITLKRLLHVPSFYIMSFSFFAHHLFSLNFKILIKRLVRLLIPYILWPLIFYRLNRYMNIKYKKNFPDSNEDLKLQLLQGNKFMHPLWFQLDLMVITIMFFIMIFIFRKYSMVFFQILFLLIYALEYSRYDFSNYFEKYLKKDKGLFFFFIDSIPFSISGLILGYYNVLYILQKHKIQTFVLSFLLYKLIADYKIFIIINRIAYPGINLNIQSICLIFIFSLFPSYLINNLNVKKFLNIITNFTGGVYYLHVPIHIYFKDYSNDIKKGTFIGMIQEYLICYFICFIGMTIFGKTPLKYMFF